MNERTSNLLLGIVLGGLTAGIYFGYRNKVKFKALKSSLEDSKAQAKEDGFDEAHQNFDQLLAYATQNGLTTRWVQAAIHGEIKQ